MKFALLVLGLMLGGSPNRLFYVCDSLTSVYYTDSDPTAFQQDIMRFQAQERVVYPKYLQSDADAGSKASLDSLFHSLLSLCVRQNALPNVERNGYGMDISIPLFHILSVSDSLFQERWDKIFPFVEKAFDAGEISNSYFFMYDRLLYQQCGKQYFGGMGKEVPTLDGSDCTERKRRYRMDESPSFFQINEQWKRFYDEGGGR